MSADVRFHNDTSLGLNGFRLGPKNGNAIRVWSPSASAIVTYNVPNAGIQGVVSNCVIDDVAGQSMPYDIIHVAFLKLDASGNPYINWLPWSLAGTGLSSEGFTTDLRTGHGHIVGMAIRKTGREIQGDARSQLLVSYYWRGTSDFSIVPAGSVAAGAGWVNVGLPIENLIWEDDMPTGMASLNFTGTVVNASLQAQVLLNGVNLGMATAANNAVVGKPYSGTIKIPFNAANPGFYSLQLQLQTDAGLVTLGAALNSMFTVTGKF